MLGREASSWRAIPDPASPPVSLVSLPASLSLFVRAFRGSSGSPSASNSFELVRPALIYPAHICAPPASLGFNTEYTRHIQPHANDCIDMPMIVFDSYPPTYDYHCFYEDVFSEQKKKGKYRHEYAERVDKTRLHLAQPHYFVDCQ